MSISKFKMLVFLVLGISLTVVSIYQINSVLRFKNSSYIAAYLITDCDIESAILTISDKRPFGKAPPNHDRLLYIETTPPMDQLAENCEFAEIRFASNRNIRPIAVFFAPPNVQKEGYIDLTPFVSEDFLKHSVASIIGAVRIPELPHNKITDDVGWNESSLVFTRPPNIALFSIDSGVSESNNEFFDVHFYVWNLIGDNENGYSVTNATIRRYELINSDLRDFFPPETLSVLNNSEDDIKNERDEVPTHITLHTIHPIVQDIEANFRSVKPIDLGDDRREIRGDFSLRVTTETEDRKDRNTLLIIIFSTVLGIGISISVGVLQEMIK